MSGTGTVVLRRTWPQRIVILACLGVIAAAFAAAWFIDDVYESVSEIGRVEISGEILLTDTDPGEPVNFLLIGTDSALGLDPDDPVLTGREFDERGRFFADSLTILRVNPETGQAWVLSLPRDLLIDYGGQDRRINSVYFVDGPSGLVEAVSDNFQIPINHFISLDFLGFREVVDALDGIPVWFANPARDWKPEGVPGSGLNIPTAGCHVLDGEQALQYVRARWYQELIDDDWEYLGNADFGRIERQQDFLVLSLERAIDRGARNPTTLSALIEAGANSIVLDNQLTVAELIDLGEAFSEFDAENLERLTVEVREVYSGDVYEGEVLRGEDNDARFAVFRGAEDLVTPLDVEFELYAVDEAAVLQAEIELDAQDFTVTATYAHPSAEEGNVVIHPPGLESHALTIAQYLEPIPRVVEDPDAEVVSLVLGSGHEQILFLLPHPPVKVQGAVAAFADGEIPDLSGASAVVSDTTTTESTTTTEAPTTTTSSTSTTTSTTTTVAAGESDAEDPVPTTTAGVIGQAPEGESCG